jgi:hypothetical protein
MLARAFYDDPVFGCSFQLRARGIGDRDVFS